MVTRGQSRLNTHLNESRQDDGFSCPDHLANQNAYNLIPGGVHQSFRLSWGNLKDSQIEALQQGKTAIPWLPLQKKCHQLENTNPFQAFAGLIASPTASLRPLEFDNEQLNCADESGWTASEQGQLIVVSRTKGSSLRR